MCVVDLYLVVVECNKGQDDVFQRYGVNVLKCKNNDVNYVNNYL